MNTAHWKVTVIFVSPRTEVSILDLTFNINIIFRNSISHSSILILSIGHGTNVGILPVGQYVIPIVYSRIG